MTTHGEISVDRDDIEKIEHYAIEPYNGEVLPIGTMYPIKSFAVGKIYKSKKLIIYVYFDQPARISERWLRYNPYVTTYKTKFLEEYICTDITLPDWDTLNKLLMIVYNSMPVYDVPYIFGHKHSSQTKNAPYNIEYEYISQTRKWYLRNENVYTATSRDKINPNIVQPAHIFVADDSKNRRTAYVVVRYLPCIGPKPGLYCVRFPISHINKKLKQLDTHDNDYPLWYKISQTVKNQDENIIATTFAENKKRLREQRFIGMLKIE